MTIGMTKQEDWDVIYPDIDPRGSHMRPSSGTPSVGPALINDPAGGPLRSPELIPAPVEPAVFHANENYSRNKASNAKVNVVGAR